MAATLADMSGVEVKSTTESQSRVVPVKSQFARRFGSIGEALAEALRWFSLDLVGVVASYIVYGVSSVDVEPVFLFKFGATGSTDGRFTGAGAITINTEDDSVWVCDAERCQIFSEGEFVRGFRFQRGYSYGVVLSQREVFISIYAKNVVAVHDYDGRFLRDISFAELGEPCSLAFDKHGQLLVVSQQNNKVFVCDRNGKVLRTMSGTPDSQFRQCRGLAISPLTHEIAISERRGGRIQVFDSQGNFLRAFGSHGKDIGQFEEPRGIAFDRDGQLLVCDTYNKRMQVFRLDGELVTSWKCGADVKLGGPYDVAVSPDGRIWVVDITTGEDSVKVFAFPV